MEFVEPFAQPAGANMNFLPTVAVALISLTSCFGATPAPNSIAGTVYRENGGIAALRNAWEQTIILGSNGRCSFAKLMTASTASSRPTWNIETPPADGSYTYEKTGEFTGTLTLSGPGIASLYRQPADTPVTLTLDFSDGSFPYGNAGNGQFSVSGTRMGYFTFTNLATIDRFPLVNVSTRGNVSEGRPLIVGFVTHGDPKDVLVRVVGPSLKQFGVVGEWADPGFKIYGSVGVESTGTQAYYDNWSDTPSAVTGLQKVQEKVGAFPLLAGSKDAVCVTTRFGVGAYTVVCTVPPGGAGGEVLVEVYSLP